jgi:hypothetical protein
MLQVAGQSSGAVIGSQHLVFGGGKIDRFGQGLFLAGKKQGKDKEDKNKLCCFHFQRVGLTF